MRLQSATISAGKQYPIFESAITGRAGLEGTWDEGDTSGTPQRPRTLLELVPQTEFELEKIREAVLYQEGIIVSIFDLLRRVPRRILMILKLNDLTCVLSCLFSCFPVAFC
jgi:aarF domain-containing kinase